MKEYAKLKSTTRYGLNARLLACCAAAVFVALAAAQHADAATVYSGVKNIVLVADTSIAADLDGDGVSDFNFVNTTPVELTDNGGQEYSILKANFVTPEGENAIAFADNLLQSFDSGAAIPNDGMSWETAEAAGNDSGFNLDFGNVMKEAGALNIFAQGPFSGKKGFIGVRFQIRNNIHYGWIRYQGIGGDGKAEVGTIVDWAYEDAPSTPIDIDPVCSLALLPGTINKLLSLISPITGFVIRGDDNAVFTKDAEVDWGTEAVKTLIKLRISPKTIIALVRVKPLLMQGGDTFKVTVDDCAGSLKVAQF
jgi:hypothetical protein